MTIRYTLDVAKIRKIINDLRFLKSFEIRNI